MIQKVAPKKKLGQHFLIDENIAAKISSIPAEAEYTGNILEIGPGMGMLTKYLKENTQLHLKVCEIDHESVLYLHKHYKEVEVIEGDFLKMDLKELFDAPFAVIGNFPYNISSQILFKIIEHRDQVPFACGMFQREVARRIAAPHGNKEYGILSVLTQSFYSVKYLFTVNEGVFNPPPKVKSGVISLSRIHESPTFDGDFLRKVVKDAFNQRRKTLRNSLKKYIQKEMVESDPELWNKRPEQLPVKTLQEISEWLRTGVRVSFNL
jgi:16S rRNA (adenine1518-N6/adenine1519-N6)-dimethyltransferase